MLSSEEQKREIAAERILKSAIETVVSVVKEDPTQFGIELVQNDLVQEFDPDDKTRNRKQTATSLYNTAMVAVKIDPEKFPIMMDILNTYVSLDTTVKRMRKEGELHIAGSYIYDKKQS